VGGILAGLLLGNAGTRPERPWHALGAGVMALLTLAGFALALWTAFRA
jgi:hypothetical protein